MKKAFTIIELLVVIGIIATLIGVLSVTFGRGTEAARNAKCLTNMKNLANAVNSFVMEKGYFPNAGSVEWKELAIRNGNTEAVYSEYPGWISWNSQSAYKSKPNSHQSSSGWFASAYCEDFETREYCITNGAVFKFVAKNRDVFVCPVHKNKHPTAAWSYVMNGWFRYDNTRGSGPKPKEYFRWRTSAGRHDRRLLFAELPWEDEDSVFDTGAGFACDPTLQYGENEHIGFNHKDGKDRIAHVVFVDGHVEKLRMPRGGMGQSEKQELTKWLCEAKDVSFDGKEYRKLN